MYQTSCSNVTPRAINTKCQILEFLRCGSWQVKFANLNAKAKIRYRKTISSQR
ncbi:hypothetical protein CAMSH0001_2150 [Campylobacter showae RM3277]|uniref:Uncharacterized protein n=1 Tax=Campylobacter showae RM3277 TaxID=553219 RepID=C6RH53_9BACT|nr:hypothetical protein CAMSH0001_2150 [Campylobacter showae RM3277]